MTLPAEPHPIVNAFTHLLRDGENIAAKSKKSSTIHKVSQVLGWRNRFSQSEYYPIELCLSNPNGSNELPQKENSTIGFKVRQVQRGELENTYGTGATVWPASVVLTKYFEHLVNTDDSRGWKNEKLNICDLGAGTGVTSIAAAHLFDDAFILCTDGDDNVVRLCQDNMKFVAHDCDPNGICKIGTSHVKVQKYWWGDGAVLKELKAHKGSSASFDIILVSGE
jgi:hypothetical protein